MARDAVRDPESWPAAFKQRVVAGGGSLMAVGNSFLVIPWGAAAWHS
jgi:hypothetical protein